MHLGQLNHELAQDSEQRLRRGCSRTEEAWAYIPWKKTLDLCTYWTFKITSQSVSKVNISDGNLVTSVAPYQCTYQSTVYQRSTLYEIMLWVQLSIMHVNISITALISNCILCYSLNSAMLQLVVFDKFHKLRAKFFKVLRRYTLMLKAKLMKMGSSLKTIRRIRLLHEALCWKVLK